MRTATIGIFVCLAVEIVNPVAGRGEGPPPRPGREARERPDVGTGEPFGRPRTGQSRYGWSWLAARYDSNRDGIVHAQEIPLPPDRFARLDRNWDGQLSDADFDWSASGDLGRRREATFALFKSLDLDSDGRLTREEWLAAFESAAGEQAFLNDENLEQLIYRPLARRGQSLGKMRFRELGEQYDWAKPAPVPGEMAPDFELRAPDGKTTVKLSSFRDQRPVVLIFGSFT